MAKISAKAETAILWPPHAKSWLIGKDSDAGRDWGQEEKGMTEDEMAGWYHRLDGHEFEWTAGVGDGQGGLACCNSWGRRVRHDWATELNWTEDLITLGLNSCLTRVSWYKLVATIFTLTCHFQLTTNPSTSCCCPTVKLTVSSIFMVSCYWFCYSRN